MQFRHPKTKGDFHWFLIFLTGGLIVKVWSFLSRHANRKSLKINLLDFAKEEKREAWEFWKGHEDFKTYCHDTGSIFEDYFIPHTGNGHKPKILRARPLGYFVAILLLVKISLALWLFFIYPGSARMSLEISTETLNLINADRSGENKGALKENPILSAAAMEKARDMLSQSYFAHQSPNGFWPWDWIDRGKYPYLYVGENLAMNFTSAESANNALLASPTHKKNIMNPKYSEVGIAVLDGELNGKKTTVMVQLFATRQEAPEAEKEIKVAVAEKTAPKAGVKETAAIPLVSEKPAVQARDGAEKQTVAEKTETGAKTLGIEKKEADVKEKEVKNMEAKPEAATTTTLTKLPVTELLGIKEASAKEPKPPAISPNQELEASPPQAPVIAPPKDSFKYSFTHRLAETARMFNFWILAMLSVAFVLNIFIRISVQHKSVLIRTLVVIILVAGMYALRTNMLEYLGDFIAVV
jgi:hypothetical protein